MPAGVPVAARANGWQVVIDNGPHDKDSYLLSDKWIDLYWAASGHVLMAFWDDGADRGPIHFVFRGDSVWNPTAVLERVLSALAGRTPERRSNVPGVGDILTPESLQQTRSPECSRCAGMAAPKATVTN